MKKNLSDVKAGKCAYFLLQEHSIGGFRDAADLNNAKYHSYVSLNLALDLIENFEGSIEEKFQYLKNAKEEVEKFKVYMPTE